MDRDRDGVGQERTRGRGRPRVYGLSALRKSVTTLGTKRLDQRSAVAIAAKQFKADLVRDLGGDVSRQQETIIELAARTWIIVEALDDWLLRQPSLVAVRKRTALPVILQRQQLADSLTRTLERLGLERRAKPVQDLSSYLTAKGTAQPRQGRSTSIDTPTS